MMYSENEDVLTQGLLMSIRYFILWCLARGIRYGYDVRRTLAEMTDGLWEINPGHIYQAFRALERDGLVTLTEVVAQLAPGQGPGAIDHRDQVPLPDG